MDKIRMMLVDALRGKKDRAALGPMRYDRKMRLDGSYYAEPSQGEPPEPPRPPSPPSVAGTIREYHDRMK